MVIISLINVAEMQGMINEAIGGNPMGRMVANMAAENAMS